VPGEAPLREASFRAVMASFPAGVTIVSTGAGEGEEPRGMTASSFLSVSLRPMLVLVSIASGAHMHGLLERNGRYAVNLLDHRHRAVARRFAGSAASDRAPAWEPQWRAIGGVPVLADAAAYVVAEIRDRHRCGDHTLFLGDVRELGSEERAGDPLAYLRGRFGRVVPHDDGWAGDLDPWGGAHGRAWG
jgi:flavin reductase (DIM6/NTAB) family NADH-FMN oxidoreductase RutF